MALRKGNEDISVQNTSNTDVNIIRITEDKLINILTKHIEKIKEGKDWKGSGGVFLTLLVTVLTSSFENRFGLDGEFIRGSFSTFCVISFVYFVKVAIRCYKNKDGVDDIMRDIKNEEK